MEIERYDAAVASVESSGNEQPVNVNDRTVVGYAVVWGAISSPRADGYRHVFERGSIQWTDDVFAFWHHDIATPLARLGNGTLRIVEDDIGACVTIDLDHTTDGENALIRVRDRLVRGMSFGGVRASMAFASTSDPQVRRVTRCVAYEVSLTPTPAMGDTAIVVAADAENLSRDMKERKARSAKDKMNNVRLAMLRPR